MICCFISCLPTVTNDKGQVLAIYILFCVETKRALAAGTRFLKSQQLISAWDISQTESYQGCITAELKSPCPVCPPYD